MRADRGEHLPIYFCGHSLGGALASLALSLALLRPKPIVVNGCYTFGQPRVGCRAFSEFVAESAPLIIQRVQNSSDVVPSTPPSSAGFHHCGLHTMLCSDGTVLRGPSVAELRVENAQNLSSSVSMHSMHRYVDQIRRHHERLEAVLRARHMSSTASASKLAGSPPGKSKSAQQQPPVLKVSQSTSSLYSAKRQLQAHGPSSSLLVQSQHNSSRPLSLPAGAADAASSSAINALAGVQRYKVLMTLVRANNLAAADISGTSDPYLLVYRQTGDDASPVAPGSHVGKSETRFKTLDPEWSETIEIGDFCVGASIVLHMFDWDKFSADDFLGRVGLTFTRDFIRRWSSKSAAPSEPVAYALTGRPGRSDHFVRGAVTLSFRFFKLERRGGDNAMLPLFRTPLAKFVKRQRQATPEFAHLGVPLFFRQACDFLIAHSALGVRGGLQPTATMLAQLRELRARFDARLETAFAGDIDVTLAYMLTFVWVRELPEPLMQFSLYDAWLATAKPDDPAALSSGLVQQPSVRALHAVASQLPPVDRAVLAELLCFAQLRYVNRRINGLTMNSLVDSLATMTCYARNPLDGTPQTIAADAPYVRAVLIALIENWRHVLPDLAPSLPALCMFSTTTEYVAIASALRFNFTAKLMLSVETAAVGSPAAPPPVVALRALLFDGVPVLLAVTANARAVRYSLLHAKQTELRLGGIRDSGVIYEAGIDDYDDDDDDDDGNAAGDVVNIGACGPFEASLTLIDDTLDAGGADAEAHDRGAKEQAYSMFVSSNRLPAILSSMSGTCLADARVALSSALPEPIGCASPSRFAVFARHERQLWRFESTGMPTVLSYPLLSVARARGHFESQCNELTDEMPEFTSAAYVESTHAVWAANFVDDQCWVFDARDGAVLAKFPCGSALALVRDKGYIYTMLDAGPVLFSGGIELCMWCTETRALLASTTPASPVTAVSTLDSHRLALTGHLDPRRVYLWCSQSLSMLALFNVPHVAPIVSVLPVWVPHRNEVAAVLADIGSTASSTDAPVCRIESRHDDSLGFWTVWIASADGTISCFHSSVAELPTTQ
jgi:Lipase (class 3)/C2 domain/RhoGAP domain